MTAQPTPTVTSRISRRQFLRASMALGASVALTACRRRQPEIPTPEPTTPLPSPTATPRPSPTPTSPPPTPTATPPPPVTPESQYREAPMLAERVARGELPPVDDRLPSNPLVLEPYGQVGTYGGTWRRAYRGVADRFGIHTTVAEHLLELYEPEGGGLVLVANVAESYSVNEDGTEFTWNLREGMRWSDGAELTSENAVWWYENILLNEEIAPGRQYDNVRQQRHLFGVEADGPYTFVCKYRQPNPTLPLGVVRGEAWGLIGGLNFMVPHHYLQAFHGAFADPAALQETVARYQLQHWAQLFLEGPIAFFVHNPELPVVGPWVTQTPAGAPRMAQVRNPYYFKVDPEGNQLPYIDEIIHDLFEDQQGLNLLLTSGQIDCQFRHVQLADYGLLREYEAEGNYTLKVWGDDGNYGYRVNPTPRLGDGTVDEGQSAVVSRADFRRALSLAIDRDEINEQLFGGLSHPRAAAPVPGSPVYKQEYEEAWSSYDPDRANALLDGLGLTERDPDGYRKRPDGQTLTLRLDVSSLPGSIEESMHGVVSQYWRAVGIHTVVNSLERSDREVLQYTDRHSVVATGICNTAVPLAYDAWHDTIGGGWGRWLRNPDDPLAIEPPEDHPETEPARACYVLIEEAYALVDIDAAHAKLMQALDIYYDQCYTLGIVGANPALGVVHNRMKNVPDRLIWANALMRIGHGRPAQFYIEE